jgi:HAD superfamily hydrolase (TIGR01490 family)
VALAIFDLDETLIGTDSDHAWGDYIADQGLVDAGQHRAENLRFYEDYKRGELDIFEYLEFSFHVLTQHPIDVLLTHRRNFIEEIIKPHILPKAQALVSEERDSGKQLIVVTATNEFITRPIADLFGIEPLLAPIPEQIDGVYTGKVFDVPSFGPGKVTRLEAWMTANGQTFEGSRFYSDSHNDLPLLEVVDEPIAVDPDDKLRELATARGWSCISLR